MLWELHCMIDSLHMLCSLCTFLDGSIAYICFWFIYLYVIRWVYSTLFALDFIYMLFIYIFAVCCLQFFFVIFFCYFSSCHRFYTYFTVQTSRIYIQTIPIYLYICNDKHIYSEKRRRFYVVFFILPSYSNLKFGSMSKGISMRKQHRTVLMYKALLLFTI